jgi:hypothetical protein
MPYWLIGTDAEIQVNWANVACGGCDHDNRE